MSGRTHLGYAGDPRVPMSERMVSATEPPGPAGERKFRREAEQMIDVMVNAIDNIELTPSL